MDAETTELPDMGIKGKRGSVRRRKVLRWSLAAMAEESGMGMSYLARRRAESGIEPGTDGLFSTKEMLALFFGDREKEQVGKLAAERRNVELKNAMLEAQIVPTQEVINLVARAMVPIRQIIMSSSMSDVEKNDCLKQIVKLSEQDWTEAADVD